MGPLFDSTVDRSSDVERSKIDCMQIRFQFAGEAAEPQHVRWLCIRGALGMSNKYRLSSANFTMRSIHPHHQAYCCRGE